MACPDRARWARCDLVAALGGTRACHLDDSPLAPRAEHWLALTGETLPMQALTGERERAQLLWDLAVRVDDEPALAGWFVQAAFDPNPVIRRLTVAAIATFGVFVRPRRAEAHALLLQVKRRGGPEPTLDAGLTAIAAAERGDSSFPVAVLRATPEVRGTMLAAWGAERLAGRPLREPEWRRLAGHVHAGRRGERLLRRLLRARTTGDVRSILQRICERRGGRTAAPVHHALTSERRAEPWDDREYDEHYEDHDGRDYHDDLRSDDGWPAPVCSPAQRAALAVLHELGVAHPWPAQLGDRLTLAQRTALARRHPTDDDSIAARVLRMLADPSPLRSLADLELYALARRDDAAITRALDEDVLLEDLRVHMHEPAADPRLRCEALRLLAAQPSARRALIAALPALHPELRPLAQLAALRPDRPDGSTLDPAVLVQLLHSALAPLLMRADPPHGLDPYPNPWRSVDANIRDTLRSGAGSLLRADYPAFTLACRPSLSVVRPEHLGELQDIGRALATLRGGLASDDPEQLLRALDAVAAHTADITATDLTALTDHACAHATLRVEVMRSATDQIREAHVRRFAARRSELTAPPPTTLAELRRRFGEPRLTEALAHAMLAFAREPPTPGPQRAVQRRVWTHRLRLLALLHELPPTPTPAPGDEPEDSARALVEHLVRAFEHAPLELAQALHIPHRQGLPKLAGVASPLERRLRHLLRRGLQLTNNDADDEGEVTRIELRPLSKRAALLRGELGRDCSSRYVPLRCLSPHHTYYGLFTGDEQRPGYVTVFECFAELESGARVPVLALETINIPDGALDGVHQDLLLALDAIASQRGLAGLAVISGIGTWNYPNERLVTASRRHRQGATARLLPADPPQWRAFEQLTREAGHYCSFRSQQPVRVLAPFDRARDLVQPENAAEAARLRAAPARDLVITAHDEHGAPAAFITAIPDLP